MKTKKRRMATKADLDKSILVDGKLPPEAEKVYRESFEQSQKAVEPLIEEIRSSRRITGDDMKLRINS